MTEHYSKAAKNIYKAAVSKNWRSSEAVKVTKQFKIFQ